MAEFRRKKKKICQMCAGRHKDITYKDSEIKKYVSMDKGKILPRRITGTCAKHQRYIAGEVKKARFMALLPFVK
ncbi:MAG: 30S ribosomal protein S18 [Bacilli bacterium]|nr:30S ribosomal protein S18 [Bacilli bacterium]